MNDLRKKKLIQEYIFLKTDLEYKKFLLEENKSKFLECVYEEIGEDKKSSEDINIESNNLKANEEKKEWSNFPESIKNKAKRVYREISKKTHPDKDPSGIYSEIFKASAIAYEECNILDLYEICEQISIQYEIDEEDLQFIESDISKKKESISQIENSYAYIWSTNDNEKARDLIVRQFVRATRGKL